MTQLPLVSVGIPTYNRPHLLQRTLESLRKQTYPNLEIIVSDNASPDADTVMAVVSQYQELGLPIKYCQQQRNIGPGENFKFVLKEAKGEFFFWLADDDQLISEDGSDDAYIDRMVKALMADSRYAYAFGGYIKSSITESSVKKYTRLDSPNLYKRIFNFITANDDCSIYGVYRRCILEKIEVPVWFKFLGEAVVHKAYPMVFESLLYGPCVYVPNYLVLKDDKPAKQYETVLAKGVVGHFLKLEFIFINTYLEYFKRSLRHHKSPLFLLFLCFISFYGLVRDSLPFMKLLFLYPIRKLNKFISRFLKKD